MWDCHINKNHLLSYSSLVDAVMVHYSVSYDMTLHHIDLYGKLNDKGVYHRFMTSYKISTIH